MNENAVLEAIYKFNVHCNFFRPAYLKYFDIFWVTNEATLPTRFHLKVVV